MPKRIVYTRHDGGVAICAPSHTAMRYMTHGGRRWRFADPCFIDRQIAKQAEESGERAARRFVMAMMFGGCTDAEAYEIMRDRFCSYLGSGCELWDVADVPRDRWFRDAWVRSHNGGPIDVSLARARPIHFMQLRRAVDAENARRRESIDLADRLIELDWIMIKDSVMRAPDVETLRRVGSLHLFHGGTRQ